MSAFDDLNGWASGTIQKGGSDKPPAGFTPIPGSKKGGYHKRTGQGYQTWYPGGGGALKGHRYSDGGMTLRHPTWKADGAHAEYSISKNKYNGKHDVTLYHGGQEHSRAAGFDSEAEAVDFAAGHAGRTSGGKGPKHLGRGHFENNGPEHSTLHGYRAESEES